MELIPAGNPKRETPLVLQAKFMLEKRREDGRPCRPPGLSTLWPAEERRIRVWTSNHNSAVLLVVLTLMTLVQTRLLFARDRAVDQRILAEVRGELGKEEHFQNVRIEV